MNSEEFYYSVKPIMKKESMAGIYSTSVVESTIDEAPAVYKPMEEIVNNIQDTVEIVDNIKPIYNFKAH